jgi:hypothetical protein
MIVTFDSNVWRKIASPDNFPKDPEFPINKRINSLIKNNKINAYLSETIFTLEAIKRIDRKEVFKLYRPDIDVQINGEPMKDGMIKLTLKIGPGKENQPQLNEFLREHFNDALNAGFKIIRLPRIGGFVNPETEKYTLKLSGDELKHYLDKSFAVAKRIEELGVGFKLIENIGLKYDEKIFDGIGKAPDNENSNIAKATAEWADGDTIACAVGINSDYICTNDQAKSTGSNSVFSEKNIELLSKEYNFKILTPTELNKLWS